MDENINPNLVKLMLTHPELIADNPDILNSGKEFDINDFPHIKELTSEELEDIGITDLNKVKEDKVENAPQNMKENVNKNDHVNTDMNNSNNINTNMNTNSMNNSNSMDNPNSMDNSNMDNPNSINNPNSMNTNNSTNNSNMNTNGMNTNGMNNGDITPKKRVVKNNSSSHNNYQNSVSHNNPNNVHNPNCLTVLTWNIWFEGHNLKERTVRIIQTINTVKPDIVCLQEVTPISYNLIKGRLFEYQSFEIFIEEGNNYGTCILCKKSTIQVVDPYYYDYPDTQMGRRLVGCEVKFLHNNMGLHILTTHLESGWENSIVRNLEFNTIKEVIQEMIEGNLIIAGDFNICSVHELIESNIASTNLQDVWIKAGCPTTIKATFNSKMNSNINSSVENNDTIYRLDRIYYRKNNNTHLELDNLKLIGLNSTSPNIISPPSDHYGLIATFITN